MKLPTATINGSNSYELRLWHFWWDDKFSCRFLNQLGNRKISRGNDIGGVLQDGNQITVSVDSGI